ncbi:MAG TPA: carotenoid 1,2-hydratase [Ramlibacter sp.]|uniref:lipocalin-like domain-containing protein n=1 Tax=Ramlibacter sp. TaxID=1917967 RepID=UPI002CBC9A60|nr:carotenoid 1,2-hydratase [Ramlibacter sp.]HVZ42908.1 carotenoid 1,2-hydratase [Ramlibacter sp.]
MLAALPGLALPLRAAALDERALQFPRDHGAHPALRTEWWYVTGFASAGEREFGYQVTFFRSRVEGTQAMRSRFAAKQLVFAHAAVTDVEARKLVHAQRIAREGFGIADAAEGDAALKLRDWSLVRKEGRWTARVAADDFAFDLTFSPTQSVLPQGRNGISRKGPDPRQASYYYSEPQLRTTGRLTVQGRSAAVQGKAWLDHEWSEEPMAPEAVGWDWIGMNLDDGSALMAFRLRRKDGSTLWDGGSFRSPGGHVYIASNGENEFRARRKWTSAASGATYPVEWVVRTPADFYTVRAVVDDQELDSRASTGAIYWEGLSDLFDSNGKRVGRGYLEMTGYASRLRI